MNITDLQEVYPNTWSAKYRGNYGIYTIKITTDGNKTVDFSCSCPSDYSLCKHIPMVEKAIKERIAKSQNNNEHEITVEQLLKDVSQKDLRDFIIRQAQNNPQFKNAVFLTFAHTLKKKETDYNQLLQKALANISFDYEDIGDSYYNEDILEIDILYQWLNKAQKYVKENNPQEALLICKACIEEYASWYKEQDSDIIDFVDIDYQERPFIILTQISTMQEIDSNELFDYCKSEMLKSKYERTEMYNNFNTLFMKLSVAVGSDDFIALQDRLLKEIDDKSSYEFQKILQQKIDFYQNNKQPEKADDILKNNLQIENFRKKLTEKLIAGNSLQEAKKLINDFIFQKENANRNLDSWYELKLQIAQKENDIPEIRRISYQFIESSFNAKRYDIYKSTFSKEEWIEKVEMLLQHYEKKSNKRFRASTANVLQAEKQDERLMKYVEKYLNIENLEKYYTGFAVSFPEKTLLMFRQTIDTYAQSTGREIYAHIVKLFEKMVKIEGGNKIVKDMVTQYRIIYKNRRAMMEMINGF